MINSSVIFREVAIFSANDKNWLVRTEPEIEKKNLRVKSIGKFVGHEIMQRVESRFYRKITFNRTYRTPLPFFWVPGGYRPHKST